MKNETLMRRIAALALTLLVLTPLAACNEQPGAPADAPASTTPAAAVTTPAPETQAPEPEFAEANYNGAEFHILMREANASSYPSYYIKADTENGEICNDAAYKRNMAVAERYGITFKYTEVSEPHKTLSKSLTASDSEYDVVLGRRNKYSSIVTTGGLYSFLDLDHVRLDASWWDENAMEEYQIAGKLFFMPNDISVSNLAGARFLYFNTHLIDLYSLENPYELVDNNKWTLEKFLGMISAVSFDLDGDNQMTREDRYGMLTEVGASNGNHMHLIAGCGIKYTGRDENGLLVTAYDIDRIEKIFTQLSSILGNSANTMTYQQASSGANTSSFANIYNYGRSLFASDHFLFVQNGCGVSSQFSDMDVGFGVAPNPKYDEAQEEYYHRMDPFALVFMIPNSAIDYDRVGTVLEYMAYQSSLTVMPAYYEVTMKIKRAFDERAASVLDIIKRSIYYEVSDLFATDTASVLDKAYTTGNVASTFTSMNKVIETRIKQLNESILALG